MTTTHDVLLFDLDGTISDPIDGIHRCLNHALTHFGYAGVGREAVATHVGPPLDGIFAALTGVRDEGRILDLVAKYRERYATHGYAENSIYPGVADVLRELSSRGARLAVCTSKRKDFAEKILAMFGLADLFEVVSGGDVGIHKWQQIEELGARGVVTERSVMIGDRAVDLTAAHRNGLSAAGVLWGYGSREELVAESPRYVFASPRELLTLVE